MTQKCGSSLQWYWSSPTVHNFGENDSLNNSRAILHSWHEGSKQVHRPDTGLPVLESASCDWRGETLIFLHSTQRLSSCVLSSDLVLLTAGSGSCQGFVRLASALAAPAGVKPYRIRVSCLQLSCVLTRLLKRSYELQRMDVIIHDMGDFLQSTEPSWLAGHGSLNTLDHG